MPSSWSIQLLISHSTVARSAASCDQLAAMYACVCMDLTVVLLQCASLLLNPSVYFLCSLADSQTRCVDVTTMCSAYIRIFVICMCIFPPYNSSPITSSTISIFSKIARRRLPSRQYDCNVTTPLVILSVKKTLQRLCLI